MTQTSCLIIGNVREGEYEGLLAQQVKILLLCDSRAVAKIADPEKVLPVARYDFSRGYGPELQQIVAELYQQHRFSSVLNYRESYVAITEQICQGQPELSHLHQNVSVTLDKTRQRARFSESPNSDLQVMSRITTMEELLAPGADPDWPCVLKPASLYSSLFVKCLHHREALERYALEEWKELQAYVANKSRENDTLLLEEYLEGSNHSIDCVISPDGEITTFPIVDVIAGVDIQRDDFHHFARYSPSTLQPDEKMVARCHVLARDAVRALGLRGTFAHVEFIMTAQGPRILEVGARPGGSRVYVIREAWGIDMDVQYHRVLSGLPANSADTTCAPFGIVTPFAHHNIPWRGLQYEAQLRQIAGFQRWYAWVKEGETVGPAGNGFQNYVYAEFHCPTTRALRESLLAVNELDVFGERARPAMVVVGGRDSSLQWPGCFNVDFTLVQTVSGLTEYQRQHADIVLTQDIGEVETWLPRVRERHRQRPFTAIVSFSELGLLAASIAGEALGIRHNPVQSVARSRDKIAFRELLSSGPWALPVSVVYDAQQAEVFVKQHGRAIIKPVDGSGSQGIYAIDEGESLAHIPFDGNQIIEKFISGDEYSVETLTLNGVHRVLGMTRKFTTGTPHYVETGHDFPAGLTPQEEQRINEAVIWLLEMLEHRWGPAHTELKIDGDKLQFIETQTRFGGDQIWEMVWLVTGVHQAGATIAAMTDVPQPPEASQFSRMAIRFATDDQYPVVLPAWLFRSHQDESKRGRPVHCSADRYGYHLYGCTAVDEHEFINAFTHNEPRIHFTGTAHE